MPLFFLRCLHAMHINVPPQAESREGGIQEDSGGFRTLATKTWCTGVHILEEDSVTPKLHPGGGIQRPKAESRGGIQGDSMLCTVEMMHRSREIRHRRGGFSRGDELLYKL